MPIYSIGYDIVEISKSSYDQIDEVIEFLCVDHFRYGGSQWIVKYEGNAEDLAKAIIDTGFGNGDKLLVIEVKNKKQGRFLATEWDVINGLFK